MAKFKALSRGTQLVLVAGPLLFLSLFLTWQNVRVDYGRAGVAKLALDGWDAWGLLLALLVIATVVLVVLRGLSNVDMSEEIPWVTICFGLGVTTFVVALVKNLTDADSSWASYAFVALAGVVAYGTYRDWVAERRPARAALGRKPKRRGLRSAA
jgi:hypothetical protein